MRNLIKLQLLSTAMIPVSLVAEVDFYEEIPMVTTVSNFPQRISEAPTAVTIVTSEMIAASGVVDLHDIFHLVPGFDVYRQSGSFGGVSYGTYPNGYPNNLDIKLDGLSIYEVFLNTTNWNSLGIDIEDIEYIEVVRGANPSVDGINSFTGSINIVTTSPLEQTKQIARFTMGSRGERNATLQFGGYTPGVAYQFTLKKRQHDGFASYQGDPVEDALDNESFRVRTIFTPSLFDTVSFQAGVASTSLGMTGGGKEDTADETEPYKMDSSYITLSWKRAKADNDYQFKVSHTSNSVEYYEYLGLFSDVVGLPPQVFYPDFPYADFEVELDTRDESSKRLDVEFRHSARLNSFVRFDWGVGHRHDQAASQLFFTSDKAIKESTNRVFANTEIQWGKFTANGAASWEETTLDSNALSLRASLNYPITDSTTLRLARNNVERGPSLMAANEYRTLSYEGYVFNIDRISSPNLTNEHNRVTELGFYSVFLRGALTLDGKLYQERSDDLLEVYTVSGTPIDFDQRVGYRANTTFVDVDGLELALQYTRDDWRLWGNLAYREIAGEALRDTSFVNGQEIISVVTNMYNAAPGLIGSFLVEKDIGNEMSLAVNYRYRDDVEYRIGGILPSASRFDVNLRKRWLLGKQEINVVLMVHNLFDSDVRDYQSFNVFDRRVYLKAELNF